VISPDTDKKTISADANENPAFEPWLFCRVASHLCAFPLSHVVETMRALTIEPLAGVPPLLLGLSVIRGEPTPVVDGAWLFGECAPRCGRFVLIRVGPRMVALAAEEIAGIRSVQKSTSDAFPPLIGDAHAMSALKALDHELAFFVDTARVVPDDVLQSLARSAQA
jgi:purine-binding chemotaxis protein CheW